MNRVMQVLLTGNATNLRGVLASSAREVKAFESTVTGSNRRIASSSNLAKLGIGGLGLAAGGLALAYGVAVGKAMQFDKAMSAAASATQTSGRELEGLRKAAMRAGADSQYSATEAAAAITEMGKAGVTSADILGGGLKGALSLAAAGQIDVAEAAGISSIAMTQFNLAGRDLPHVADLLAAGAGKAMGSVDDLGAALKQSGLVASAAGMEIEETTGTLSAFASAGLIGSDAGTSLKTMLQMLQAPTEKSAETMRQLGIDVYDSNGSMLSMSEIAGELKTGMSGLTDEQRNAALATIFGADAVRAANVLYKEGADGIETWTKKVDDQGYAVKTAAELTDNLSGDLERLGGSFETLMIQVGSGAQGPLRYLTQGLTGAIDGASGLIDKLQDMESVGHLVEVTGDALGEVWDVLVVLGSAVAPIVGGLASIGGSVIVGGLTILATALGKTADFLGDNEALAVGLATVLAFKLVGGITGAQVALWRFIGTPAVLFLSNLLGAVGTTAGALSGGFVAAAGAARTALMGLMTAAAPMLAVAAVAALGYEVYEFATAAGEARDEARAMWDAVNDERGGEQIVALDGMVDTLKDKISTLRSNLADDGAWETTILGGLLSGALADKEALEALENALRNAEAAQYRASESTRFLAGELHLSQGEVQELATRYGVDLTGMAEAARSKFIELYSQEYGTTPTDSADATTGAMQSAKAATEEATAAQQAWLDELQTIAAEFVPVLGTYNELLSEKQAAEQASAEDTAASTSSSTDSWKDYVKEVDVSLGELADRLEQQLEDQANWRTNIGLISQWAGMDVANYLAKMGKDGVEIVAKMADGTTADAQRMATDITKIIDSGGDAWAGSMDNGTKVMEAIGKAGASATRSQIAKELGIGVAEVQRIADQYGVALATGINPVLSGIGKKTITINQKAGRRYIGMNEFDGGGYTGPGRKKQVAGLVHAGEVVWSQEDVAAHGGPQAVDEMRRLRGYAEGGIVALGHRFQAMGARVSEHPAFGGVHPVHVKGSKHYTGDAIDVNTRAGTSALEQRELAPMDALARSLGFRTIFLAPGHYNHLHADTGRGGSSAGALAAQFMPTLPAVPKFPYNGIAQSANKWAEAAREQAQGFLDSQVSNMIVGQPTGTSGGSAAVQAQVRAVASRYGWGAGAQWNSLSQLIQGESGWNPNAANPSSSARGLFQKMTSLHGPVEPTAAGQAEWGLNYIRGAYGSPAQAYARWLGRSPHWYDEGGLASGSGYMPKKAIEPERVLSPRQTVAFEEWMKSPAAQRGYGSAGGGANAKVVVKLQPGDLSGMRLTGTLDLGGGLEAKIDGRIDARNEGMARDIRSAFR